MNEEPLPPHRRRTIRIVISTCAVVMILFGVFWNQLAVQYHRTGMEWANAERAAYDEGRPRGFLARNLSRSDVEAWSNHHRDALVRSKELIHRQFLFANVACPSVEAQWLEQRFYKRNGGRVEAVYSSSGRGHNGEYAVNLWCPPDRVAGWDEWFQKLDGPEVVEELMAAE